MSGGEAEDQQHRYMHETIVNGLSDADAATYHALKREAQKNLRDAYGKVPDAAQDRVNDQILAAVLTGQERLARIDPVLWQNQIDEARIGEELARQRIRDQARKRLTAEHAADVTIPAPLYMSEFIEIHEGENPQWLIDRLWPQGGRILLTAQFKAGKTTLVANLLRSLVDGTPFLAEYGVDAGAPVLLIDTEMNPGQLAAWADRQGIRNEDTIQVLSLRGNLSGFNILEPDTRTRWAERLKGNRVVILDNLRPVLDALGLDENHEAGRFLTAWDEFIAEMGASESLIVQHQGHSGERARGDSALMASNDAIWSINRESKDNPASPRYFSAFGRDVDEPKARISLDPETGHLSLNGGGPAQVAGEEAALAVLQALRTLNGDVSGRKILEHVMRQTTHAKRAVVAGTGYCVQQGWISQREGARGALLHNLTPAGIARIGSEITPEIDQI